MIRPAQESDASAMADVLSDWIDATPWMPRLHSHDEDLGFCRFLVKTTEVFVADPQNGFGFLARKGDAVDALYLSPDLRRQGWGTALIDAIKHDRRRLTLWTFQTNKPAIAFYEAQNFHITDLTDGSRNAEKLPDCLMTWTRSP